EPALFFMRTRPPASALFPYTTLFRSPGRGTVSRAGLRHHRDGGGVLCRSGAGDRGRRFISPDHDRPGAERGLQSGRLQERGLRRSEEHTSELQSRENLVCCLLLEKKK